MLCCYSVPFPDFFRGQLLSCWYHFLFVCFNNHQWLNYNNSDQKKEYYSSTDTVVQMVSQDCDVMVRNRGCITRAVSPKHVNMYSC